MTGISYARARWLDTRTGHWLSEDPLFDIDSPNLYAFVGWQPSMATDPLGLCFSGLSCRELLGAVGDAFRDTGKDVADFFTGPFRDTGEAAEETAASARRTDRTLRSNMGNRDPVIDALLAEDYEGLELPSRLHQQELRELGESARAMGATAGHAGRTAGHALNAADRYLLGTGLYKVAVIGGRRVVVRKSVDEILEGGPGPPGGGGFDDGARFIVSPRGVTVERRIADRWARGTFDNVVDSIEYHFQKHGAGRTLQQYTDDATGFFQQYRDQAQWGQWNPNWERSYRLKVSGRGGYYTADGRVLTYWD